MKVAFVYLGGGTGRGELCVLVVSVCARGFEEGSVDSRRKRTPSPVF